MATFANVSELGNAVVDTTTTAVITVISNSSTSTSQMPTTKQATTLSPGHAAILEMHANSSTNALIYIAVVLGLYIFCMSIIVIKYIRTERYEARLTRLFHSLMQRDRFFRLSRRRSSLPKCGTTPNHLDDVDLPFSPAMPLPEIHLTLECESKL